jgi:hypothetical protein
MFFIGAGSPMSLQARSDLVRPQAYIADAGALDLGSFAPEKREERSTSAIRSLGQKIALIARVFSRNYDLDVLPSPDGGWRCAIDPKAAAAIEQFIDGKKGSLKDMPAELFRPKQIFYDSGDVATAPEDEVMGVLRHEVGHAIHTDFRLFFEGQRLAKEQGYLPSGWANIQNALEDPWINNLEIADSDVVRENMTKRYAAKLPEVVAKIDTLPLTRQIGLNIIHHWLTGQNIPTLKDKRVLEVFEKIKPHAEKYFHGESAQANFDTLLQNIWPDYREVETKALNDEELKELARRASNSDFGQSSLGNGEQSSDAQGRAGGSTDDSGIKNAWSKIRSAVEKFLGQIGGSKKTEDQKDLEKGLEGKTDGDLKNDLRKELKKQSDELEKIDEELQKNGEKTGNVPEDISLEKLSPELKEKLEELRRELAPELKEKLEQQARKNLDEKQSQALKESGSSFLETEVDPKTGDRQFRLRKAPSQPQARQIKKNVAQLMEASEAADAQELAEQTEAQEQRDQETAEQIRQELERREMLQAGFTEEERELYKKFKDLETPMQSRIRNFIQTIEKYLPKQDEYTYGGEYYTGRKVNERTLVERAPVKDYRIFERRQPTPAPQARMYITLVIDNSGSMKGEKMEESLKTAVFWGRVLQEFGIPFSIKFFGDQVRVIKKFEDDYDDGRNRVKPNLVKHADASGGSTDMSEPLLETEKEMALARRKFATSVGAVFVISDSGANRGLTGPALTELIARLQKNYIVSNFILSTNANEIKEAKGYFGEKNVIAPVNFQDLPDEAFKVLRVTLERMLRLQGAVFV